MIHPRTACKVASLVFLAVAMLVAAAGSAVAAAPPLFDFALQLDGIDDTATAADGATLDVGTGDGDDFTIEGFFYVPDLANNGTDVVYLKSSAYFLYIMYSTTVQDRVVLQLAGSTYLSADLNLATGWHHLAGVYDNEWTPSSDLVELYLDGNRIAQGSGADWTPGIPNGATPLNIGSANGANPAVGWFEEFRISNTVRYNAAAYTVPSEPFIPDMYTNALWHFNEDWGSAGPFADASANGNTLTGHFGILIGNPSGTEPEYPQAGPIYIVNTPEDTNDGVCGTVDCSLREAVASAAAETGENTVVFDDALGTATITLSLGGLGLGGDTDRTTIDGGGDITVSGADLYRVFHNPAGGVATLRGLTITHGNSVVPGAGGGVLNEGTLEVDASTISASTASSIGGGGIYNTGTLDISESIVWANQGRDGAGIFNTGTLSIEGSAISGNTGATQWGGGGLYQAGGSAEITDTILSGNLAREGAGISIAGGSVVIDRSTFEGNQASVNGGAISATSIFSSDVSLAIANSTFKGNSGGAGGALLLLYLTNDTQIINSTIAGNTGTSGGGVYMNGGTITVRNTILADNGGGNCQFSSIGLVEQHNLDSGTTCTFSPMNNSIPSATVNLGPLQDNGGPTLTMLPGAGSQAIDAGDGAVCAAAPVSAVDQRGISRPINGDSDGSAACDIGAVEAPLGTSATPAEMPQPGPVLTANTFDSSQDGMCGKIHCSLREAVMAANAKSGANTIELIPAATYTLNLVDNPSWETGLPVVTSPITLNGNDAVLQRSAAPGTPAFHFITVSENGNMQINDLELAGGTGGIVSTNGGILAVNRSTMHHNASASFGAIWSSSGASLSVADSDFYANGADRGGAVFVDNTPLAQISGSNFTDNSAGTGGAIYGPVTVTSSTFTTNTATDGGALGSAGTASVTNSTFTDNSADSGGGAIYAHSGTLSVSGGAVSNNSASYGGAIYNYGATVTLTDLTIAANTATDWGGAISTMSPLEVSGTDITGNTTTGGGGGAISVNAAVTITEGTITGNAAFGDGGAIQIVGGSLTITGTEISGNTAADGPYDSGAGGAISAGAVNLTITNSTLSNNTAADSGGAVAAAGTTHIAGSTISDNDSPYDGGGIAQWVGGLTITGSTLTGNSAGGGGGAVASRGALNIINSTLAANTATYSGGAINADGGTASITNTTISGNSSGENGALHSYSSSVTLANSIIANSLVAGNCNGPIIDGGHNVDSGTTCGFSSSNESWSNTDPLLGTLAANGGPTMTMMLLAGSPAVDRGDAAVCAAPPVGNVDQRGTTRPINGDKLGEALCDIGAFEAAAWAEPGRFSKSAPLDAASGQPTPMTISWNSSADATSYEYCVKVNAADPCYEWTAADAATSIELSGLSLATTYYWQARGVSGAMTMEADDGNWWSFTTIPPDHLTISGNADVAGVLLSYDNGGPQSVTADAAGDYSFDVPWNWSGTVTPALTGYSFTPPTRTYTNIKVDQLAQDYAAALVEYELSVTSDYGDVSADVPPPYHYGDEVQLTLTPWLGWEFAGWSGAVSGLDNPLTVVMDGNKDITATYNQIEYTLTFISDHGTVAVDTPPPYHYGDFIQISATAEPGWVFWYWSGGYHGPENPAGVSMTSNKVITANYTQAVLHIAGNAGLVGATINYDFGTPDTVTTDESGNYYFELPYGSSGTVTPFKAGYSFGPMSLSYDNLTTDVNDADFAPVLRTTGDFDRDGKTDAPLFEKATGNWFVVGSTDGFLMPALGFGNDTAFAAVPADYDGDGKTDAAVFEKATGNWFVVGSSIGFFTPALGFGNTASFIPVQGDYDGDGKADAAVFERATGHWFVVGSQQGFFTPALGFGNDADFIVVPADYDGDGKMDPAVFEKATGNWFVVGSTNGFMMPALGFGTADLFIPLPGDYDGDQKADAAVFERATGNWFAVGSKTGFVAPALAFGNDTAFIPQPGDFDGDGRMDAGLLQWESGHWLVIGSSAGFMTPALGFGGPAFTPLVWQAR